MRLSNQDFKHAKKIRRVLIMLFPHLFIPQGRKVPDKLPLKVGIKHELFKHPEVPFTMREIEMALGEYTGGTKYRKALLTNTFRYGLDFDGPRGFITDDQKRHALVMYEGMLKRFAYKRGVDHTLTMKEASYVALGRLDRNCGGDGGRGGD